MFDCCRLHFTATQVMDMVVASLVDAQHNLAFFKPPRLTPKIRLLSLPHLEREESLSWEEKDRIPENQRVFSWIEEDILPCVEWNFRLPTDLAFQQRSDGSRPAGFGPSAAIFGCHRTPLTAGSRLWRVGKLSGHKLSNQFHMRRVILGWRWKHTTQSTQVGATPCASNP